MICTRQPWLPKAPAASAAEVRRTAGGTQRRDGRALILLAQPLQQQQPQQQPQQQHERLVA
jgi:hypothetical protein